MTPPSSPCLVVRVVRTQIALRQIDVQSLAYPLQITRRAPFRHFSMSISDNRPITLRRVDVTFRQIDVGFALSTFRKLLTTDCLLIVEFNVQHVGL